MASWFLILRSDSIFMRYINESQPVIAMPNLRLTSSASKFVLCGTLIEVEVPFKATASVLAQTTRIVVGVAVVARVPSHDVAKRR